MPVSSVMSSYHILSRAAVYLNNVGIDLLKRGCHRQAMETFTDAVEVMQLLYASHDKHNNEIPLSLPVLQEGQECLIKTEKMLYNAAKRLSQATSATPEQPHSMAPEIISDDHDPVQIMTEVLNASYLIRIETVGIESSSHEQKTIEAAIILYNYGTTFQSLVSLNTSQLSRTKLYLGALKMLRLSYVTLFPVHRSSSERHGEWSSCGCLSALLILRKLIAVTRLLEMSFESGQYMEHLDHLKAMVHGTYATTERYIHHAGAA